MKKIVSLLIALIFAGSTMLVEAAPRPLAQHRSGAVTTKHSVKKVKVMRKTVKASRAGKTSKSLKGRKSMQQHKVLHTHKVRSQKRTQQRVVR